MEAIQLDELTMRTRGALAELIMPWFNQCKAERVELRMPEGAAASVGLGSTLGALLRMKPEEEEEAASVLGPASDAAPTAWLNVWAAATADATTEERRDAASAAAALEAVADVLEVRAATVGLRLTDVARDGGTHSDEDGASGSGSGRGSPGTGTGANSADGGGSGRAALARLHAALLRAHAAAVAPDARHLQAELARAAGVAQQARLPHNFIVEEVLTQAAAAAAQGEAAAGTSIDLLGPRVRVRMQLATAPAVVYEVLAALAAQSLPPFKPAGLMPPLTAWQCQLEELVAMGGLEAAALTAMQHQLPQLQQDFNEDVMEAVRQAQAAAAPSAADSVPLARLELNGRSVVRAQLEPPMPWRETLVEAPELTCAKPSPPPLPQGTRRVVLALHWAAGRSDLQDPLQSGAIAGVARQMLLAPPRLSCAGVAPPPAGTPPPPAQPVVRSLQVMHLPAAMPLQELIPSVQRVLASHRLGCWLPHLTPLFQQLATEAKQEATHTPA